MVKKYRVIRFRKAAKIAAEREILRYRVIQHEGEKLRVAITKKPGPRGGHTVIVAKLKEIKRKEK